MTCTHAQSHVFLNRPTMSSFFLPAKHSVKDRGRKGKIQRGRKKDKVKLKEGKKSLKKHSVLDEEIASDSDVEDTVKGKILHKKLIDVDSDVEGEEETAPEKRLRLAKEYLLQLDEEERREQEQSEVDYDAIAHRLRQDVLDQAGKLQRKVADLYNSPVEGSICVLREHQLPVTCVAVTPDDKYIYSGSKDCCIIKWSIEEHCKEVIFSGRRGGMKGVVGHTNHVLAIAVSSDGKFMVSGGHDRVIHVWDVETSTHLHTFTGHRDSISGLTFRRGTHELFSCSFDRTVKLWNVDEMAYVETLFGHQDSVSSIDCLSRERPVSAGMNDRTVRVWKVIEESQLVFHGHKASIDCVKLINEEHFVSGSQDGTVALWSVMKKKPLILKPHHVEGEGPTGGDHWVTSVAAYPSSDLIASGSSDGHVHLWKCGENFRSLEPCFSVPLHGFINALAFSHRGDFLVAAVGQEHRLGRWWRDKKSRNSVVVVPLTRKQEIGTYPCSTMLKV